MATKDISRTVIEGGRYYRNKRDRRTSNRLHRAGNRRYSKLAVSLIDPDDLGALPKRRPVRKDFKDKLGPVYRWMSKQVGRKWDIVFSNLVHEFDTRTTAGRHVVNDHIVNNIIINPTDAGRWHYLQDGAYSRHEYYLDENGIIQSVPVRVRVRYGKRRKEILEWVNNRLVMDYGVSLFWMDPKKLEWTKCGTRISFNSGVSWVVHQPCDRTHRFVQGLEVVHAYNIPNLPPNIRKNLRIELDAAGRETFYQTTEHRECLRGTGPYRQGERFSPEDEVMWRGSLIDHEREKLTHPGSVQRNLK